LSGKIEWSRVIKKLSFLLFAIVAFTSCKKDVELNQELSIESILVNDSISVNYHDSLVFVWNKTDTTSLEFVLIENEYNSLIELNIGGDSLVPSNRILLDSNICGIEVLMPFEYSKAIHGYVSLAFEEHTFLDSVSYTALVTDSFLISFENRSRGFLTVDVFNVMGQIVESSKVYKSKENFEQIFDVSSLMGGVYFWKISYGSTDRVGKFVKQ
jgi:hypothetical protein